MNNEDDAVSEVTKRNRDRTILAVQPDLSGPPLTWAGPLDA